MKITIEQQKKWQKELELELEIGINPEPEPTCLLQLLNAWENTAMILRSLLISSTKKASAP